MDLSDSLKSLFIETAQTLKGHARRRFTAQTVKELVRGGQRRAERDLGWNRETIRKGLRETLWRWAQRIGRPLKPLGLHFLARTCRRPGYYWACWHRK